jgi:hypothetical protein
VAEKARGRAGLGPESKLGAGKGKPDRRAPPVSARGREGKGGARSAGGPREKRPGRAGGPRAGRKGEKGRGRERRPWAGCEGGKGKKEKGKGVGQVGWAQGEERGGNFICYPNANEFEFEV